MEDPESKNALVNDVEPASAPLTMCSIVFRLKREKLALRELIRFAAAVITIQFICLSGILFMRPPLPAQVPIGRWFAVISMLPICVLYVFIYANLITGPWGSEDSRFWCDVRIMYVRGFNTIRTVINMFSSSFMLMFLSVLMGNTNSLSLSLIFIVCVLSEWQSGCAENTNQYEVKAFDKFMDGNILCLETLHFYQIQNRRERQKWSSFIFSIVIKLYLVTAILLAANLGEEILVFQVPIATLIIIYVLLLPPIQNFIFLKGVLTFSQLELYRIIMDLIFPMLIVTFSLV